MIKIMTSNFSLNLSFFRIFSNLHFSLLHEYPRYFSVLMESHFKCCLQQVAAKTLGLHVAITYSYNGSWKTIRHKKEEDQTPIPSVPQNPGSSLETWPSTHAFLGWELPLSQATTASTKSVAQMKLNLSNSCFATAVKWQNCPCHTAPNLRILSPFQTQIFYLLSWISKNTAYVLPCLPFPCSPNEPEPNSRDNQQDKSDRTSEAIIFILIPPSSLTQKTEWLTEDYTTPPRFFFNMLPKHIFQ